MKNIILSYLELFFGKHLELRVRLFHVLAITGVIICVIMTGVSVGAQMWGSTIINAGAGIVSAALLFYSARTHRYQPCYYITIIVIFFVLFPCLFFYGGGYKGGMPFFFVFAVVFTVYMLDGWAMISITLAELVFYSLLCAAARRWPETVVTFPSEAAVVTDVIIGLVTVSIALGATMFAQDRLYRRQQKELEEARKAAEAASRAKSTFLAGMSHEIRTPIHMILGMNEIIRRESSSQVREYSEKIDETSKMLLSLVDNVLDVAKIESGKMELIPSPYKTAALVQTLILIGKTHCRKKGLEFTYRIDEALPSGLCGDLAHIRQIAGNLLSNAAKYTPEGRVHLEVFQESAARADRIMLCISVKDTGIGIRREALDTLFDAFSRADLAEHRNIEGTGLGLAIVRELTDLMGGTVSVESEVGKGSTFTVRLPQTAAAENQQDAVSRNLLFLAPDVKILVVDDNEANRTVMQKLLSITRASVDTAESGRQCLEMAANNDYHLILMDYMMPEMDGLQTMERLRQLPGFTTPVIALTADATAETRIRLLKGGFSSYLTKPVPWPQLRDTMLSYLPEDLVRLVPEETPAAPPDGCSAEIAALVEPYGIYPEDAMEYFEGSMTDYCTAAGIFLRHSGEELQKIQTAWANSDCTALRFPLHGLKGKAKNLGISRLAQLCEDAEKLCAGDNRPVLDCLLPYLLCLRQQAVEGLELLLKSHTQEHTSSAADAGGDCRAILPGLLREFRRKPSLICLDQLLKDERSEQGRQLLKDVRQLTEDFSFDRASQVLDTYLERKWEEAANDI